MAAAVVTVIIEDFLQSLGNGMKNGQQWGVEHELIEIRDILSSIRGVLPIAENLYGRSLELQDWVRKLKGAVYDAEDLIEELSVEEALWNRKRNVRRLLRPIVRLTFGRRMRDALQAVARRLQELIGSDPVDFIRKIPAGITEVNEAAHAVPLIWRDDRKGKLIRLLLNGGMERDLPVLSVGGDDGIEITAIIREVLSELEVSRHYDVIIWVNASPPFDENRLARDIIASLTNGFSPEEENVVKEELLLRVGKLLDGRKKYLFILYDLWVRDSEIQRWVRFWSFLEGGANGSKILVTTRDLKRISSSDYVYLRGLTREESRDLLLKTAFKGGVEEIIDPAKLEIIEEVATLCHGFVQAVGGYLSLQHDTSDWSSFRDIVCAQRNYSVSSKLLYGGYPYGHLGPMVKRYNNLPPRIKQCFGLCSLFPRGQPIDQQTLAELWISLGYIKPSNEDYQPLEDIAYNYFNRLLMEEFFLVKKFVTFGKVGSVVLHPDADDLARCIAGWECGVLGWNDLSSEQSQNPRHISINDYYFPWYIFIFTRMRTVICSVDNSKIDEILCNLIPHLERARVLDAQRMKVEAVPEDVWKLKHLRYLNLSDNRRIETLPPEITDLLNLQTLKLSGCWALKELPKDMRKMVALRHLYIDGCRKLSLMPKGLGDLKFLNILTDFILPLDDSSSVDSANLTDLCKLKDLRGSLRITNLGNFEAARERFKIQGLLDEKSSLESVELKFMNLWTDTSLLEKLQPHQNLKALKIDNYGGTEFPEWMNRSSTHLPNLVEIALIGCKNCEYLPQFGQMRHLKSLTTQGLPNLLCMESGSGQTLSDVDDNTQPFGELSSLCITDCPKLENLPLIPHLTKLTLVNVSNHLFGHPFWVASSLKTLRPENIELLHHLSKEWLREPTSLEELHIRSCPKLNCLSMMMPCLMKLTLANVGEELFKQPCHFPRLKTLRLENIELLDHLPKHWLQHLTCLKELHIGSCPSLVSLSRGMMHLENLESLSIWNCKNLDLSKDEQDNFMMELQGLKSLKCLTIYKTLKMEYLPEWLSRIYTLRFLVIRSCPNLVALPEWIGNLRSLKLIELVHCPQLTSLPAGMHEFTNDYPRKLSIIGCPLLQSEGIEHSRKL